jgi:PAS domain-containing protein
MQKEVSQAKSNFEAMIENTEDIITLLDRNLNLIAFNSAYVAWVRARAGRIRAGDNCNTLLKAEERDWWHDRNVKALEGKSSPIYTSKKSQMALNIICKFHLILLERMARSLE